MDFERPDAHFQYTTGPGSVEPDEDYGESDSNGRDRERSVDFEKFEGGEVPCKDAQTHFATDGFENVSNRMFDTGEWSSERQRPTRVKRRPTSFRYSKVEMQFRPEERSRKYNKPVRRDQARSDISNVSNFIKYIKKRTYVSVLVGESSRSSPGKSTYRQEVNRHRPINKDMRPGSCRRALTGALRTDQAKKTGNRC